MLHVRTQVPTGAIKITILGIIMLPVFLRRVRIRGRYSIRVHNSMCGGHFSTCSKFIQNGDIFDYISVK